MRGKTMVAKVAKQEITLNLPRRPTTVERYLKIVKFALGRNRDVEAVAKHFGCSPATVLNAIRAFGVTYDQVRRRRTLPQLKVAEEYIRLERRLSERDQKIVEMYNSPEAPTLEQIGRAFGLTRQRVHQILKKAKALGVKLVERKTPPEGHWIERCQLCKRILQLQEEEPLLTRRQIAARLSAPIWVVHWHLNRLKARGLVERHFGYFRSERLVQAIKLYNSNPEVSAWKLGRMLGYKNLPGIFCELEKRGLGYLLRPRSRHMAGRRRTTQSGTVIDAKQAFRKRRASK